MIRHCVFLQLLPDRDPAHLTAIFQELEALCAKLSGASGFCAGPNRDFERKSQSFAQGFTIDFDDAKSLQTYAEDPKHKLLGARLCDLCRGGAEGIMVFDLEFDR